MTLRIEGRARWPALILLCLGVQIIWEGVSGLLGPLLNAQVV